MESKLIKFNQVNHDNELHYAETDLKAYNRLLKDIKPFAVNVGVTVDKALIVALLNNPKEFAFDAVVGNNPLTIGGAPVSKKKAMDLIDMPEAWVKIISRVDEFNQELIKNPVHNIPHQNPASYSRVGLESFELVNNEFVLSTDFVDQLKSKHSQFTENETHNTALKHIVTLNDCLKGLSKLGCSIHGGATLNDFGYYRLSQDGNEFGFDTSVVIDGIKHREWFAGLSAADKAKYNLYGAV
jgi:hypothetical protein